MSGVPGHPYGLLDNNLNAALLYVIIDGRTAQWPADLAIANFGIVIGILA